ncbi:MAG TPA: Fic family protein [Blastocatellia bacterium]|nr:Fic family protein [Blastocatellia bacterium]
MGRPPIFSSRPDQQLFNRVNRRFEELGAIPVSAEQKQALSSQLETEMIHSTLGLEGIEPSDEKLVEGLREAFRIVQSLVESEGRRAGLSVATLSRLGAVAGGGLRRGAGPKGSNLVAAERLPLILEGACMWFAAESFGELNPAEQSAIVVLRLIGLHPFEEANQRLSLIAASLFTMRSGLPPIILGPEQAGRYRLAVEEGLQANTKPLVELIAESLEKTLASMIARLGEERG